VSEFLSFKKELKGNRKSNKIQTAKACKDFLKEEKVLDEIYLQP
jgi:hypothetical protein